MSSQLRQVTFIFSSQLFIASVYSVTKTDSEFANFDKGIMKLLKELIEDEFKDDLLAEPMTTSSTDFSSASVISVVEEQVEMCPAYEKISAKRGILTYPSALGVCYANDAYCEWHLTASVGQRIILAVAKLSIEVSEKCFKDRLVISDSLSDNGRRPLLASLCGFKEQKTPCISTGSDIFIVFISDNENSFNGFKIIYNTIGTPATSLQARSAVSYANCSTTNAIVISDNSFTPAILQYPASGLYRNNIDCYWLISGPTGSVINIAVIFISMEAENDSFCMDCCIYDVLIMYDGNNVGCTMLFVICGFVPPSTSFNSSGSQALIEFFTDTSIVDYGFAISYSIIDPSLADGIVCSSSVVQLRSSSGTLSSPGFTNGLYPSSSSCAWNISTTAGYVIVVTFSVLILEESAGCVTDSVTVYAGSNTTVSSVLGCYCGTVTTPFNITSLGQIMFILLSTDSKNNEGLFAFNWTVVASPTCGVSSVTPFPNSRIVGGIQANPHSWPWMGSFQHFQTHICGCTILSGNWILTAAHCIVSLNDYNVSNYRILVGAQSLAVMSGTETYCTMDQFIINPLFNNANNDYDSALCHLTNPLTFNSNVQPCCLPLQDAPDDTMCTVIGWGLTEGTGSSTVLNQAYVPVISTITCNQTNWYGGAVSRNMICAGYADGKEDACQGDSGGPLLQQCGNSWYIVGIVSWGHSCAAVDQPGVYTRVTRCVAWIASVIQG